MNWKKAAGWACSVLLLLVVIAAVRGYFYLKSNRFQEYALRKIEQQANQATGGRAHIGVLDFNLSTLTAHLHHVVLRGSEQAASPPLLEIDELTVGVKIDSVLHRRYTLNQLVIQHPVVHLEVDSQGRNNLPEAPKQPASHTSIFDLSIRHCSLADGEINYNDKKIPLDADLYDLAADVLFDSPAKRYSGTLAYGNGRMRYAKYSPMPHSFKTRFSLTPSSFSVESAELKIASSTLSARGEVTNLASPVVTGEYGIRLHSQDFSSLSRSFRPAGDLALRGTVHYRNEANRPFLRSLKVAGEFASGQLSAATETANLEVRQLKGTYQLENGNLRAQKMEGDSLGGHLVADLDVRNLDTTPASHVRAELHAISLPALQRAARQAEFQQVAVAGTVDGTADAAWTGALGNLRGRFDLAVRAAAKSTASATNTPASIPLTGAIHAVYDGPANVLALQQTVLRTPSATLTASGELSRRSSLRIHVQTNDLHQLVELGSGFSSKQSPLPAISGTATLDATMQGSLRTPQISAQVEAQNLRVQGTEWTSAQFAVSATPSGFSVARGVLTSAQRGRASFDGSVDLGNWSYRPENPIRAHLSVQQFPIADLQHLASVHYPVTGELSADISLSGSQQNLTGSGSATIANARAYDEPLQTFTAKFRAANGELSCTAHVAAAAGAADTSLTYVPKTKAYQLRLDAPATDLEKIHAVQAKNLAMKGTVAISANGEGTLEDPQLTATIQVPMLEIGQQSIAGLKADLRVANQQANFNLDSEVGKAPIHARGHVDLSGDYQTEASIDTGRIALDTLLASFSRPVPEGFQGQTELHATVRGPVKDLWKDKARLEAHLTIPILNASYQQFQIAAAGPIRADYVDSVMTVQPADIRGTGTSLRVQGTIPFAGSSPANFTAKGSVDVALLRIFAPDVQSSGAVALDIRATGSPANPSLEGQIRIQDVNMSTPDAPLGVEQWNGTLDVGNDRLRISNMTARVGGGQVSAGGSIVYRPSLQFNVALQGNSVRLRYPTGLRSVLDANATFSGNTQESSLNGRVLIDTLSFTPEFDLASFGDQFSTDAATAAQPGLMDTIHLAIGVQSKANLSATSSQVSMTGSVDWRVRGTAANPVVTGRTTLTSGELFYRKARYQLQRGIITFDDPNRIHPNLDVSVTTKIEQFDLTMNLRGPLDRITTSYQSDPPLATADIINLLAFGRTTSESAASSASQSTDSMLAQNALGSGVSSGVQKLAGISNLQIDPLIGGNNQNPSARVALQQRVTKNFLFTFSTDVSQPGNEMVEGDYQLNKRWSVSVTRDQLGGVAVDGRYHTKF